MSDDKKNPQHSLVIIGRSFAIRDSGFAIPK